MRERISDPDAYCIILRWGKVSVCFRNWFPKTRQPNETSHFANLLQGDGFIVVSDYEGVLMVQISRHD